MNARIAEIQTKLTRKEIIHTNLPICTLKIRAKLQEISPYFSPNYKGSVLATVHLPLFKMAAKTKLASLCTTCKPTSWTSSAFGASISLFKMHGNRIEALRKSVRLKLLFLSTTDFERLYRLFEKLNDKKCLLYVVPVEELLLRLGPRSNFMCILNTNVESNYRTFELAIIPYTPPPPDYLFLRMNFVSGGLFEEGGLFEVGEFCEWGLLSMFGIFLKS